MILDCPRLSSLNNFLDLLSFTCFTGGWLYWQLFVFLLLAGRERVCNDHIICSLLQGNKLQSLNHIVVSRMITDGDNDSIISSLIPRLKVLVNATNDLTLLIYSFNFLPNKLSYNLNLHSTDTSESTTKARKSSLTFNL